jgi:membrane associated rhomboid family serine protease
MNIRLLLWMLIMAWVGFFIAGKGSYLPLGVTISGAVMGAGAGLMLGFMFSRREKRRHVPKSTLTRY